MLHWREPGKARVMGDAERDRMARDAIDLMRKGKKLSEAESVKGSNGRVIAFRGAMIFVESGDAIVLAFKSDRAPDEVEVIDATVRRRGEDAPRGGER